MYAGFEHANGEYVVTMDVDLQDPPHLIPEMIRSIEEEGYDSVATRRVTRKENHRSAHFSQDVFMD